MEASACPVCRTESFVPVLSEGPGGDRVLRRFCRECERRTAAAVRVGQYEIALGLARLLVYAGVALGLLAFVADYLGVSGHSGFGWRQVTGTEVGFLVLAVGVLTRRMAPVVIGLLLLVVSLGADFWSLGRAPGIGWREEFALAVATALILAGSLWRRVLWRWTWAIQSGGRSARVPLPDAGARGR